MSAETTPADPDSIAQPHLELRNTTVHLRLGRKELAIRLSWKKGKWHLISLCLLEGLSLFMVLAKDLL